MSKNSEKRIEKVERTLDLISEAYGDAEIAKRPAARKMLLEAATQLQKSEDVALTSTKLTKQITLYYLDHKGDFPGALQKLYMSLKREATVYDATMISAMMLPVWFN
jgi:hypothetical protein